MNSPCHRQLKGTLSSKRKRVLARQLEQCRVQEGVYKVNLVVVVVNLASRPPQFLGCAISDSEGLVSQ